MTRTHALAILAVVLVLAGCAQESREQPAGEIAVFRPGEDQGDLIASSDVEVDPELSSDGGGSLRISVTEPQSVPLYEVGDLDVEDATLTYRAKLRTEDLEGSAYLEMWCEFGDRGDYFSRGLDSAIGGTTDWTSVATSFFLQAGENPTNVRLNVVVDGAGTVWVDGLEVVKSPLPQ